MVVGVGAVRGLFVAGFVCWYSTNVFKAMDSHFGNHFGKYLKQQLSDQMRKDLAADRKVMERVLEAKGKALPPRPEDALLEPGANAVDDLRMLAEDIIGIPQGRKEQQDGQDEVQQQQQQRGADVPDLEPPPPNDAPFNAQRDAGGTCDAAGGNENEDAAADEDSEDSWGAPPPYCVAPGPRPPA